MDYVNLGSTGLKVSRLCLGMMTYGAKKWREWVLEEDEARPFIKRALDAGINFFDTADIYSDGVSEEITGRAMQHFGVRRDSVVIATKVFNPMGNAPNQRGLSRKHIMSEVDASLKRLQLDYIDLYQVHNWDPSTPFEETLSTLNDLVRAGKVRYIGHSTWPASAIVEAQWTARERSRERFVSEQPPYSILTRGIEADVLPTCARYGMGVIPWSPLAGGWLSGRYRKGSEVTGPVSPARQRLANRFDMSLEANQRKLDAAEKLAELANEAGMTLIQMAIAFVLRHPAVTAAIIGPRTMEHLESQLAAADIELSDDLLDGIDQIVPPGTTINPADGGWVSPALEAAARRR